MLIKNDIQEEGQVVSQLEGELIDQAALLGVLNWLYELILPVLSVGCLSFYSSNDKSI
jgi:hypothetical protein